MVQKLTAYLILYLIPMMAFSQIGREFKFEKIKGDAFQSTEKSYENIPLDETGMPILPEKTENETVNFYQDGYLVESQYFEYEGKSKELSNRILIKRVGPAVHKAEIYTYRKGSESLLRAHDAKIENDKIISEKIRNERNEDIGSVQYSYGKTTKGLDFEWIDVAGNRASNKFYTESDAYGAVFSMEIHANDTLMRFTRIEMQSDTFIKSLLVKNNGINNLADSILVIVRQWFDIKGNPTLILTQMEALTKPPHGEPKTTNFVTSISYQYGKATVNREANFPKQEEILGAWRSKANNLELFFEPESVNGKPRIYGSSYLSKSNEPTIEQLMAAGEIWIFMLKQDFAPGNWIFDASNGDLTIALKNGSILEFSTTIDINTLVLTPKMKDMSGSLRLVKSQ